MGHPVSYFVIVYLLCKFVRLVFCFLIGWYAIHSNFIHISLCPYSLSSSCQTSTTMLLSSPSLSTQPLSWSQLPQGPLLSS